MTVEVLAQRVEVLMSERQRLREENASDEVLEHNRRTLIDAHRQLARALIARHLPGRRAA